MQHLTYSLIFLSLNLATAAGNIGRKLQRAEILVGFTLTLNDDYGRPYDTQIELRVDTSNHVFLGGYEASTPTKNILLPTNHTRFLDESNNDVTYVPRTSKCPVTYGGLLFDIHGYFYNVYSFGNNCIFEVVIRDTSGLASSSSSSEAGLATFTPIYSSMTAHPTSSFQPSLTPTKSPTRRPTSAPTQDILSRHMLGAYNLQILIGENSSTPTTLNVQYYDDKFISVYNKNDDKQKNILLPLEIDFYSYDNIHDISSTFCPVTYDGLEIELSNTKYNIYNSGGDCYCYSPFVDDCRVIFEPITPPAEYGIFDVFLYADNGLLTAKLAAVWIQNTFSLIYDYKDNKKVNILDISNNYLYENIPNDIKYISNNTFCPVTYNGISVLINNQHMNIYLDTDSICKYFTMDGSVGTVKFYPTV